MSDQPVNPRDTGRRKVITLSTPAVVAPASHELQPGMTLGRRYQIARKLGAGGMGEVYEARDLSLDDSVALKVLFPQYAGHPQAVESLRREIRATRKLRHPSITRTFDWGASDGRTFMVMEYIPGEDLEKRLARGPLELLVALRLIATVLEAIGEAHTSGVLHCDLKTSNLLLTPEGQVRVMDFGLAAMRGLDPRRGWGTPAFASPEQAGGGHIDARSDLYSLGVVFYHLLTGRLPYGGSTNSELIGAHRDAPIPDPRAARPELPAGLAELVVKLLAKRPDDRIQSALDARVRLRAVV